MKPVKLSCFISTKNLGVNATQDKGKCCYIVHREETKKTETLQKIDEKGIHRTKKAIRKIRTAFLLYNNL